MKKVFLAALAVFGLTACSDNVEFNDYEPTTGPVEIVVDFEDNVDIRELEKIEKDLGIDLQANSPLFGNTKVTTAKVDRTKLEAIEDYLEDLDNVEAASINHVYRVDPLARQLNNYNWYYGFGDFPNDPLYKQQWNFDMIDVEGAWDQAGDAGKGVVVAVLDTGLSDGKGKYGRVPDLAQTNFAPGFNFVQNDDDPYDKYGHGTHVAGTIAQSTHNGIGVTGIAFDASLMSVKVLSDQGFGSVADIAEGIRWAADNGAHVINMSLGGGAYSTVMEAATKYAYEKNVFLACAAGNNQRAVVEFPAGYDGCHAVSAVDKDANLAWYSSHGESRLGNKLFISAPGGDTRAGPEGGVLQDTIKQNDPTKHGYYPFQGTSMATPHVAGVAALVIGVLGTDDYTVDDVEDILAESATDKDDFTKFGHGILNAKGAVELALEEEDEDEGLGFLGYLLLALISLGSAVLARVTE